MRYRNWGSLLPCRGTREQWRKSTQTPRIWLLCVTFPCLPGAITAGTGLVLPTGAGQTACYHWRGSWQPAPAASVRENTHLGPAWWGLLPNRWAGEREKLRQVAITGHTLATSPMPPNQRLLITQRALRGAGGLSWAPWLRQHMHVYKHTLKQEWEPIHAPYDRYLPLPRHRCAEPAWKLPVLGCKCVKTWICAHTHSTPVLRKAAIGTHVLIHALDSCALMNTNMCAPYSHMHTQSLVWLLKKRC